MRQQKQAGIYYDLEENERLCAIALVKRLFPHLLSELIPCKVPVNYPSTPYLAAVNWIGEAVKNDSVKAHVTYAIMASSLPEVRGTRKPGSLPGP
ncbi:MAG: hypothetical protein ACOX33_08685 [Dethiobacteria bacterium]